MSVGETILRLIELGATPEMIAAAAEGMVEAAAGSGEPRSTPRQERNRRYYERLKASEKRLKASEQDGSDAQNDDDGKRVPTTLKTKQTNNNPPSSPTGTQTPRGVPAHRGASLPDDWQPSEAHLAKAEGRGFDPDWVAEQGRRMRDWALGNRNRPVARKADWDRTFHGWIDREMDRARPNGSRGPPVGHPDLSLDGLKAKIAERAARERATH